MDGVGNSIVIVEYSPEWSRLFEQERRRIVRALGERLIAIEHIGSTSVPGLAAKPLVDIMAGLRDFGDAAACIEPLQALGYAFRPEVTRRLGMDDDALFVREAPGQTPVNLHVTAYDGSFWREKLLFRDLLRSQPALAHDYEALKRLLAGRFPDGAGYSVAKGPFIKAALNRAGRAAG